MWEIALAGSVNVLKDIAVINANVMTKTVGTTTDFFVEVSYIA